MRGAKTSKIYQVLVEDNGSVSGGGTITMDQAVLSPRHASRKLTQSTGPVTARPRDPAIHQLASTTAAASHAGITESCQ